MNPSSRLLVAPLACLLLALLSCAPPPADYHAGSEGLTVAFRDLAPDAYEATELPVLLTVANEGAWDVPVAAIRLRLNTDPFYAAVREHPLLAPGPYSDRLAGRQPGFPEGDAQDVSALVVIQEIEGLRESPTTELFATICYPYATRLATSVCVDSNAYNRNAQRQVCQAETLTYQDQGAPVAVTRIESRPTPTRDGRGVTPTFIIHVANVGEGSVLLPLPDNETRDAACVGSVPEESRGLLNSVGINASLSGAPLRCDPEAVPLRGGAGYATCTLPDGEEAIAGANYLAILEVALDYLYRSAASAELSIIRRPGGAAPSVAERDAHPGYVHGQPRCTYCTANPNDPACEDLPPEAAAAIEEGAVYACACSQEECLERRRGGDPCLFGASWCPGSNYCCAD